MEDGGQRKAIGIQRDDSIPDGGCQGQLLGRRQSRYSVCNKGMLPWDGGPDGGPLQQLEKIGQVLDRKTEDGLEVCLAGGRGREVLFGFELGWMQKDS